MKVGKVKKIDCQGHPLQKSWRYEGHDTAWVPAGCGMVPSGRTENCVSDPSRITVISIWHGPNPEPHDSTLLVRLALVMLFAVFVIYLFKEDTARGYSRY